MITPNPDQLSQGGKFNRYTLVIATAKCARKLTDEYIRMRYNAEKLISNKETDKNLSALINKDLCEEKAVTLAVNKLYDGEYVIVDSEGNEL